MASNYPTSLDTSTELPSPTTGAVIPASADANRSEAIIAVETKLGTGASTPSDGTVLKGTGAGTSAYGTVDSGDVSADLISGQTAATAVGTDYVLISDSSDAGNLKKALISDFASAGGDMAAATYDPAAIGEQLVGLTAAQTLTNKKLSDSTTTIVDELDNTKAIAFQASGITTATTRTITMPDSNVDLANVPSAAEKTVLGNTSGTNTGDESAASSTAQGIVELATIAEVDAGTDTARAITPAGLAGSALQTKVDGIEANADVTDAANVAAAGALMDSEVTSLAAIKSLAIGTSAPGSPSTNDIWIDTN